MPKENLSAGVGVYASAVMASDDPFCRVAAGWRLRICICGHGETFLSAERRPRLAWAVTKLWSGVHGCGEPAVPAGRGVPERGEALSDARLGGALVALGGPT